jgi:hypothetical protein
MLLQISMIEIDSGKAAFGEVVDLWIISKFS